MIVTELINRIHPKRCRGAFELYDHPSWIKYEEASLPLMLLFPSSFRRIRPAMDPNRTMRNETISTTYDHFWTGWTPYPYNREF